MHRYPSGDGIARILSLMEQTGIDLLVDVGASDGGYAQDLHERGYAGRLVSYEPLAEPYSRLHSKALAAARWTAVNAAVGDTDGSVTLNIAGNNGESSSSLPMLDRHVAGDPTTAYVGTEECRSVRLDTSLPELLGASLEPFFLKVDVQGNEMKVLEGCRGLIDRGLLHGMQVELSFVELYEGATRWRDVFDFAESQKMELVFLRPGFSDPYHYLLQADAFFFRQQALL